MLPPVMSSTVASKGERDLFEQFKSSLETGGWTILHSLDIARHKSQVFGEIDFILMIPNLGILCLEVKACHGLEIKDGRWRYGQSGNWDSRGAFKQASEAMHSLRSEVVKKDLTLSSVVFCLAVAFTHMNFDVQSPEWHSWQSIDREYLAQRELASVMSGVLKSARRRLLESPTAKWFKQSNARPNAEDIVRITELMRLTFEAYESPKARIARSQEEAKRYTKEQFRALDFAEGNQRVVFEGPAGTGKDFAGDRGCAAREPHLESQNFIPLLQ